jgi:aminoacyl tRNA synthase complex-interacting multifunctional protein 1
MTIKACVSIRTNVPFPADYRYDYVMAVTKVVAKAAGLDRADVVVELAHELCLFIGEQKNARTAFITITAANGVVSTDAADTILKNLTPVLAEHSRIEAGDFFVKVDCAQAGMWKANAGGAKAAAPAAAKPCKAEVQAQARRDAEDKKRADEKAAKAAKTKEDQEKQRAAAEAKKQEELAGVDHMSKVALLCGVVVDVAPHPEADHLYVEKIDLGEEEPRTVVSGLRAHMTPEELTGARVVVAANLEPRKMRGVVSAGMVLCAASDDGKVVKVLAVPAGVPPGERIVFPGHAGEPLPVLKKKLAVHWTEVADHLKTDDQGVATYEGAPFATSKGPVTAAGMPNTPIS